MHSDRPAKKTAATKRAAKKSTSRKRGGKEETPPDYAEIEKVLARVHHEDESETADRFVVRPAAPVVADVPTPEPVKPERGNAKWSAEPSIREQRQRQPESVRRRPRKAMVFDLSLPADLENYNKLLALLDADQPLIDVFQDTQVFHEGSWRVLFIYAPLEFQVLV